MPENNDLEKLMRELQLVNDQRTGALKSLKDRLSSILTNEKISPSHMSATTAEVLRDVGFAVNSACQTIEAHDKLFDMIIHDLTNVIQVHDRVAGVTMQSAAMVQTVIETLKRKGITTEEELKQLWKEISERSDVSPT